MTKMEKATHFSRRAVLKAGGALVVSIGTPIGARHRARHQPGARAGHQAAAHARPALVLHRGQRRRHGRAFFGKMDMGQGLLRRDRPDRRRRARRAVQGRQGVHGPTPHQREPGRRVGLDRHPVRRQADALRRGRSAPRAGRDGGGRSSSMPADQLTVTDGVVHAKSDPTKKAYLRRADRRTLLQRPARVEQADRQRALCARQGAAEEAQGATRSSASRSRATTSRRRSFCARASSSPTCSVPGMVHAPHDPSAGRGRDAGEGRRRLDQGHPGRARGARGRSSSASSPTRNGTRSRPRKQLKVEWSDVKPPFPDQAERSTTTSARRRCASSDVDGKPVGNVDEAFKTAARVIEAEYEWPFQSHACMGPACAVVEIKDGQRHLLDRLAEAALRAATASPACSACQPDKVDGIWVVGRRLLRPQRRRRRRAWTPPCWRRRSARRCALQYTRERGHRLGSERPRLDPPRARGDRRQRQRRSPTSSSARAFSRIDVQTNEQPARATRSPATSAASPLKSDDNFGVPGGVLRVRQQADARGRPSRRSSTAPRRCAPRTCAIRSGRRSTSPASRSWTRWRMRSASIRSSSGCAT